MLLVFTSDSAHELNSAWGTMFKHSEVIINADDLGYSGIVNASIFELMAQRRLTSATMLANAPAIEDAVRSGREFRRICSFGVHLCLTEFSPVTKAGKKLPFLNESLDFDANLVSTQKPTGEIRRRIYEEWCGQIRLLQSLGIEVSHIDSHHHVHTKPWLFPVLKAVQRTFGIRKARISMNLYYGPERRPPAMLRLKKWTYNSALRTIYPSRTTKLFTNLSWFARLQGEGRVPPGSVELMVHPGAEAYEQETELLRSERFFSFLKGYRLITYHDL